MSEIVIRINRYSSGQPRPYADSQYQAKIFVEFKPDLLPPKDTWRSHDGLSDDRIKSVVKTFVHDYKETPGFADARLTRFNKIGPGEWDAQVTVPFLD